MPSYHAGKKGQYIAFPFFGTKQKDSKAKLQASKGLKTIRNNQDSYDDGCSALETEQQATSLLAERQPAVLNKIV